MNYIYVQNQKVRLDSALLSENRQNFPSSEIEFILSFINRWKNEANLFDFTTSGSTGEPKNITLSRSKLKYSATQTLNYLNLTKRTGKVLLAIPPQMIGGTMLIVRALEGGFELEVMKPSSDFHRLTGEYILTSLVPRQVRSLLQHPERQLLNFENLLIGGAPLDDSTEELLIKRLTPNQKAFHTYGMTETASHIALREVGTSDFVTIGDTQIDTDARGCLRLKGTLTDHEWLQTNDLIQISGSNSFQWKGRADFMINSGGYKISPEEVEKVIRKHLPGRHILITSLPEPDLGDQVVLLVEGQAEDIELDKSWFPHPYQKPRKVLFTDSFAYNKGGKIDRLATHQKITSNLS